MSDTVQAQTTGIHEESPGVKSSKRVYGALYLIAGGALLLAIGIAAIFVKIADADTAIECAKVLAIIGAGLLGVGVLEGIGSRIGKKTDTAEASPPSPPPGA